MGGSLPAVLAALAFAAAGVALSSRLGTGK